MAGEVEGDCVSPGLDTGGEKGFRSEEYFGGGDEILQVIHHGIDGEWDRDCLADSTVQVFVRSAAAFGSFQVKHHSFFCAGGGEGRGFAEEEGGDFL